MPMNEEITFVTTGLPNTGTIPARISKATLDCSMVSHATRFRVATTIMPVALEAAPLCTGCRPGDFIRWTLRWRVRMEFQWEAPLPIGPFLMTTLHPITNVRSGRLGSQGATRHRKCPSERSIPCQEFLAQRKPGHSSEGARRLDGPVKPHPCCSTRSLATGVEHVSSASTALALRVLRIPRTELKTR